MAIKSISTIQSKVPITGSTVLQIQNSSAGGPVLIYDIEGEVNSTTGTNYFIQLLNTATPSSGVTVPLYSRLVVQAAQPSAINGFSFVYRPTGLDTAQMTNPVGGTNALDGGDTYSVWVAISSTDAVWTSVAALTNVTVDIEDTYIEILSQTVSGDLTTGVDNLAVFTDPNATKKLIQFIANNNVANLTSGTLVVGQVYKITTFVAGDDFTNVGATVNQTGIQFTATGTTPTTWSNSSTVAPVFFIMLFGYTGPAANAIPLQYYEVVGQTTGTFRMGSGLSVQQSGKPTQAAGITTIPDYALHTGCYLYGSSTPLTLTATSSSGWNIKAWNI